MEVSAFSNEDLEALAFACDVLAPLFLNDPATGALDAPLAEMAALDVPAAAADWPFVEPGAAQECLAVMAQRAAAQDATAVLSHEYRRLYVGPGHLPVPPWGSVYTDRDQVVFGRATLDLRAWMRAGGIARVTDEKTPEDHIGLLLALVAWCVREKPECTGELLARHILPWSGHMLSQLEEATEEPFYAAVAKLTRLTLKGAGAAGGLHITTPKFYR